ncbi:hypothetical protein [Calothrix sp. UHCC 0171]|uniref:hypothetical protein n=1 Tax=Calothrix sp. UHCC 0171 TaxID=3110245 RepID=UPI002B20A84D|nr:hypothetical protein [Calothrix sp. UHCC 0171]MEA5570672.1 hypothetical protein [Calothrix sp. UHCC 0171]
MARAIERIERDIQSLEAAIALVAQELYDSYTAYLSSLGQAVRQQLMLATYHLCTQGYPEAFLRLSLSQRQKVQQAIRNLGTETAEQLLKYINAEPEVSELTNESINSEERSASDNSSNDYDMEDIQAALGFDLTGEVLENTDDSPNPLAFVELSLSDEDSPFDMGELDADEDYEDGEDGEEGEEGENNEELKKEVLERIPASVLSSLSSAFPFSKLTPPKPLHFSKINPSNPVEISKWQQSLEMALQFTLKKASRDANLSIQKSGILPKKLPEPILEIAAVASEATTEVMPGPPNLINLVIEVDGERRSPRSNSEREAFPEGARISRNAKLTKIMAIHLRLGEIEFADVALAAKRKQIRILMGQLQKLRRDYLKKQRERAVVEAENAWRASWFED